MALQELRYLGRRTRRRARVKLSYDVAKRERFLSTLVETGSVRLSCKAIGISRMTAHRWRNADEAFAREWELAKDMHVEAAMDKLAERAIIGVKRPIYQKGQLMGYETIYSDNLLIYHLERLSPFKFFVERGGRTPASQMLPRQGGRVTDVLNDSAREADKLMNHPLVSEDGAQPIETAQAPIVPDRQLLDAFRSHDQHPDPVGPRLEEKDDKGI